MTNPICTNAQGNSVEYINCQWMCNNSHSATALRAHSSYHAMECPACKGLWSFNALKSQLTTSTPTPQKIPAGHGRVHDTLVDKWIECPCGGGDVIHDGRQKLLICSDMLYSATPLGCGAEWDYNTVQAAAIGTDLPSKQTALTMLNNSAGRGGSGQALLNHQAMQQGIVPIVKPYARKFDLGKGGGYGLECFCGQHAKSTWAGFECCSLFWSDADVQAASVGDLLPGTPIGQQAPLFTAASYPQWKAVTSAAQASGNYFGPPATPPLLDQDSAAYFESEPEGKPTCPDCQRELSSTLDTYYGRDDYYGKFCAPCRRARGH